MVGALGIVTLILEDTNIGRVTPMTLLRTKCSSCGHWNRVPVNKIFIEQPSPEPKAQVLIPMYEPLEVTKCKKCGKIIAESKELVRILRARK